MMCEYEDCPLCGSDKILYPEILRNYNDDTNQLNKLKAENERQAETIGQYRDAIKLSNELLKMAIKAIKDLKTEKAQLVEALDNLIEEIYRCDTVRPNVRQEYIDDAKAALEAEKGESE